MSTCAVYHRVSTTDQHPDALRTELREAARRYGYAEVLEIEEIGSGARNNRPGWQRVMDAAKKGQIDAVLVHKLDRAGRSCLDLLANLRALETYGCRFVCVSQGIDIRPNGDATSKLLVQMLSAIAEFERSLISERTITGLRAAKRRGKRLGRSKAPRGDVARVKALRASGASWSAIAKQCGISVWAARQVIAELVNDGTPAAVG